MNQPHSTDSLNVPFVVPYTHRLRFTKDVLGAEQQTLADLLEPSGDNPARVQFWLDQNLSDANPEIKNQQATSTTSGHVSRRRPKATK